jgi:hypothetical protein
MATTAQRMALEELKDVKPKDTGSRRRWELMLVTACSLLTLFGVYQLLHRAFGLRIGAVERWKRRHPRDHQESSLSAD